MPLMIRLRRFATFHVSIFSAGHFDATIYYDFFFDAS